MTLDYPGNGYTLHLIVVKEVLAHARHAVEGRVDVVFNEAQVDLCSRIAGRMLTLNTRVNQVD